MSTLASPTVKCSKSEAQAAKCRRCNAILTPNTAWPLSNTVWLHTHGSCGSKKFDFYRLAGA